MILSARLRYKSEFHLHFKKEIVSKPGCKKSFISKQAKYFSLI